MIEPIGVEQKSIVTSLGRMVYYSPCLEPWQHVEPDTRPTMIFLHGFGGGSSAYEWSKVYPAFANEYRVLAPRFNRVGAFRTSREKLSTR